MPSAAIAVGTAKNDEGPRQQSSAPRVTRALLVRMGPVWAARPLRNRLGRLHARRFPPGGPLSPPHPGVYRDTNVEGRTEHPIGERYGGQLFGLDADTGSVRGEFV